MKNYLSGIRYQEKQEIAPVTPSDESLNSEQDYPLTKQQQALWIEHRLHPSNTSYNTCVKLRLTGKLDTERFRQASQLIVDYFDSLRVYFVEKEGIPYQRVAKDAHYLPEFIDISDGAPEETPAKAMQAKDLLSNQFNTPIDLKSFPIMRGLVIKTASEVFYFIGMVPHIISDGRVAILYLESLSIAYNGGQQALEETYGKTHKNWEDFYAAGLHKVDAEFQREAKKHWQDRLAGASHSFDYSYGKRKSSALNKDGEMVYFDLSVELSKRIKAHSKANRTTLFNVFVCIFSIFVKRYYGLTDVLIGYPVNICPPGFKHFFGFFVNIVPIRVDMRGNPSYGELLQRVHKIRKEDKKYQKYPSLDIVSSIRERLPDFDGQVFNLSMAQTVSRLYNLQLNDIVSEPLENEHIEVNDDFSLSYELIDGRISLWFEYRQALFERPFIDQAMKHIESIIKQALDSPDRPINEFALVNQQQQAHILRNFSGPWQSTITTRSDTIVTMFEAQVEKTPDAIAALMGNDRTIAESISYTNLNRRANQLAHYLLEKTCGKNIAIGIALPRGIDLVVALMATLKAGCHYIPLPASYPAGRIHYILRESCAGIFIDKTNSEASSSKHTAGPPIYQPPASIIHLDLASIRTRLGSQPDGNPGLKIRPDTTAYVIYTSGSTGKPKGVILNHGNITPRLTWLVSFFNLTPKDRMLQSTDFSFDVSVAEIFWPLCCGSALVVADQEASRDPGYLLELIEQHRVTTVCMVPSLLNTLLDADKYYKLASLNQVLSAGEPLAESIVDKFLNRYQGRMFNFYGPTEAAIYATYTECLPGPCRSITIGKPLGDTSTYILDKDRNLQPIGVVGELYIGGPGVAVGYLNNQELNNRHFIDSPFAETGSRQTRLYATGDLARFNFDGDIEFIGRKDRQVKIRGFRIEPGEIENSILQCQSISDVAVIELKRSEHQSQLIAYIAPSALLLDSDQDSLEDQARKQVCAQLPAYMMPSMFIKLDNLPRLLSGKLDRKALPEPTSLLSRKQNFQAASSGIEKKLATIWSIILGMETDKLDVNTSFFDLGGDSLMAIQFVSLAEEHKLLMDISDIFERRTIAELAVVAKIGHRKPVEDKEVQGCYPLLPRQARFFADKFTNPNHWNRTFNFELQHHLDTDAFAQALNAVLSHHDNLRIRFRPITAGGWLQEVCPVDDMKNLFTHYDLSSLPHEDQISTMVRILNQHHRKIGLTSAPMMQVVYIKQTENSGKLSILFHHLLLDMVSSRIIFEDLIRAYTAYRAGISVIFPPKTDSVKAWAIHLEESLSNQDFQEEIEYWGSLPATAKPDLPLDYPLKRTRGKILAGNTESSAQVKVFTLNENTTRTLLTELPITLELKLQDFLLGNLFKVISTWSCQDSMTLSMCSHGRPLGSEGFNLSRTVGWLNTVFPVYLEKETIEAKESRSVREKSGTLHFFRKISEQINRVPANQMAYNLLRYVARHPELNRHESPQIFFNYVGQLDTYIPRHAPFIPAADLKGVKGSDGNNHLCYQLYFEAAIINQALTFRLTYSESLFKATTIENLVNLLTRSIENNLAELLA